MQILETHKISPRYTQYLTTGQAWTYRVVPFEDSDGVLHIYVDKDLWKTSVADELGIVLGVKVKAFPIEGERIDQLLSRNYRKSNGISQVQVNVKQADKFVGSLLAEAHELGSSDIHIEALENHARIRLRLDGHLIEKYRFNKSEYAGLVNQIKIKSHLDISEKRLPQDGRIQFTEHGRKFDIRVSILPTLHGEKIVLRILSNNSDTISLEKLGLNAVQHIQLSHSIRQTSGIILVSGPTGSGKTTTLYAILKQLNEEKRNILTVEDPVEYTLEGINQVQLKESIGLNFSRTLRSFLRQDPDVLMVGEIRDKDTAEIAVRAALTGHLVLSTIHTNSAWGTISRLIDMGIPPYLLANTMISSIAQRLVRVLCNHCKQETMLSKEDLPSGYQVGKGSIHAFAPKGCDHCHFTGYYGRKAVYEIIPIDRTIADHIRLNTNDISEVLKMRDIFSLAESSYHLLTHGITSIDEIYPILMQAI